MKVRKIFKKYNYNYKVSDKRSNKLYTLVSNYEYDKKIDTTMVIAGYISDNLVYESDKEENWLWIKEFMVYWEFRQ